MANNMAKFSRGYSVDDLCRIAIRCNDSDTLYELTQQQGSNPVIALKIVSNKYADGRSLRWLIACHIDKVNKLPKDTKDELNVLAHSVKVLIRIAERCNDVCSENADSKEIEESTMLLKKMVDMQIPDASLGISRRTNSEEVKLYLAKKCVIRSVMARDKKPNLVVWYCLHRMKNMDYFIDFIKFASAEVIQTYLDSINENPNITADVMKKVEEKLYT